VGSSFACFSLVFLSGFGDNFLFERFFVVFWSYFFVAMFFSLSAFARSELFFVLFFGCFSLRL